MWSMQINLKLMQIHQRIGLYNIISLQSFNPWTAGKAQVHVLSTVAIDPQVITPYILPIDGLVQERCNSIALAVELRLSCTKPS